MFFHSLSIVSESINLSTNRDNMLLLASVTINNCQTGCPWCLQVTRSIQGSNLTYTPKIDSCFAQTKKLTLFKGCITFILLTVLYYKYLLQFLNIKNSYYTYSNSNSTQIVHQPFVISHIQWSTKKIMFCWSGIFQNSYSWYTFFKPLNLDGQMYGIWLSCVWH